MPVYKIADQLPKDEKFDLRDQMCQAIKSVVDNIVEGYSHKETPTKAKSFWRALMGSANEMVEHLEQVVLLDYVPALVIQPMADEYTVIAKQLNKLIQKWKKL